MKEQPEYTRDRVIVLTHRCGSLFRGSKSSSFDVKRAVLSFSRQITSVQGWSQVIVPRACRGVPYSLHYKRWDLQLVQCITQGFKLLLFRHPCIYSKFRQSVETNPRNKVRFNGFLINESNTMMFLKKFKVLKMKLIKRQKDLFIKWVL